MNTKMSTYEGGCHCGKIHYKVEGDFNKGITCNCSLCAKAGWILFFVPESQFSLISGDDETTDYQFAKKNIHHLFCSTCGVRSYGYGPGHDGNTMMSINARCLKGFDIKSIELSEYDGAAV